MHCYWPKHSRGGGRGCTAFAFCCAVIAPGLMTRGRATAFASRMTRVRKSSGDGGEMVFGSKTRFVPGRPEILTRTADVVLLPTQNAKRRWRLVLQAQSSRAWVAIVSKPMHCSDST